MAIAATEFRRAPAPLRLWWAAARSRALQALLRALDRLVSLRRRDNRGPAPEWFKYPPI